MKEAISIRGRSDGDAPIGSLRLSTIERFIVYVGVFLAPYANLRFSEFFFTASDFLFCLSFAILLMRGSVPKWPLRQTTQMWFFAFLLLFMGLLIGSLAQGTIQGLIVIGGQYFFSYIVLMFVLVREDPKEAYRIAAVFLATIILVDIHGIYTFYFVGYVPGDGVVTGARRLATVLRDPNQAASINALTMPILLYFWSVGRLRTYLALPLIAIVLVTVVLTSSNSGLAMMVVCLTAYAVSIMTSKLMIRLVLGGAILVGVVATFGGTELLPDAFQKRVLGGLSSGNISESGTFIGRTELIKEALGLIAEKHIIVVGVGADQFREVSVHSAPVHVLYLLLWVEGGLLAVMGWVLFSGVGVMLWLSVKKTGGSKHAQAVIATIVAVFLTIALFYPHMYARYWTLPVFLCFGLGLTQLKRVFLSTPELGIVRQWR